VLGFVHEIQVKNGWNLLEIQKEYEESKWMQNSSYKI
jgi:hypothetical protein